MGDGEPTVLVGSTAPHEPLPFQPVQQSCYVRRPIDEPLGDRVPGVSLRVNASKDPQDVVLVVRDAMGRADFLEGSGKVAGYCSLGFAIGGLLFGFIADIVSIRWLYPFVLVAWSVAGLSSGPATSLAGLGVSWRTRKETGQTRPIADRLCEMGRFGQKTEAGFYRYSQYSRAPQPDAEVAAIVEEEGRKRHDTRREIGAGEIVNRCMLALVNEGAKILEEGIALRASDIDVTYVYGYSFPVYRGGPMFWACLLYTSPSPRDS